MITVVVKARDTGGLTVSDVRDWLARYDAQVADYAGEDAKRAENAPVSVLVRATLTCLAGDALELSAEAPARAG